MRGEVWTYEPVLPRAGQSRMRLILSVDAFNADGPTVMGLHVVENDPGGLLSVRVDPHGWAVVNTVEQVMRRRLGERVGAVPPVELEQVEAAFRALFGV